tara:strand:+ start:2769 stop:3053 length:285 start_codon:yes stop_codon:yes gene_type:complete
MRTHNIDGQIVAFTADEEAAADAADAVFNSEAEVNKRFNAKVDRRRIAGYATDGDNFDAIWKAIDALSQGNDLPSEVTDTLASRAANKAANPKR